MNKNVINYIEKYGNFDFDSLKVNELDILIFSLFPYLRYDNLFINKKMILKYKIDDLILLNEKDDKISVLKTIKNKKRYENIKIKDYTYKKGYDYQFGALTILLDDIMIISFEGTDSNLCGFKEDFDLSYKDVIPSEKLACKYLRKALVKYRKKCIVTGHSKGGLLAVFSAMNENYLFKNLIDSVYSFDGPGLSYNLYKSSKYEKIRNKIINIIPEQSIVGVLLNQDERIVVKSIDSGIRQHRLLNWQVNDKLLIRSKQSNLSINFEKSVCKFLDKYDKKKLKIIIDAVYDVLVQNDIQKVPKFDEFEIKKYINMIKNSKLDKTVKKLILESINFFLSELEDSLISYNKEKMYNTITKIRKNLNE